MLTTRLKITGMTCHHCVMSVQKALASVPGIKKAEVSLDQKQAVIQSEGLLNLQAAVKAVEEEGYQAAPG